MDNEYYIIDSDAEEIISRVQGVPDDEELERLANAHECSIAIISASQVASRVFLFRGGR